SIHGRPTGPSESPEGHTREADHAPRIDVPLLVPLNRSPRVRANLEERVERGRAAPLEVVVVFPYQVPEAARISRRDPLHPMPVAGAYREHPVLVRKRRKRVSVAASHVRHVDAEDPKQTSRLARGDLSKGAEKALHAFVVLRVATAVNAV